MIRGLLVAVSVVVFAAALVLSAARRDVAASYDREQVVSAFTQQGIELTDPSPVVNVSTFLRSAEVLLVPASGEPFFVFLARTDALARKYFEPYERLRLPPETFDLLRGNVMVISDSGLSKVDRRRVRAAIRLLPEPRS